MATKRRSRSISDGEQNIDRISVLPDEILCHILSFLPTKSSVATSALARRWRFIWTHWTQVPNFSLELQVRNRKDHKGINGLMLSLHKVRNIDSFRLTYDNRYPEKERYDQIMAWISTSIARNVRKLDLQVPCEVKLPGCIFTCKTLVDLRLRCFRYIPGGFTICLPSLKKFHLHLNRSKHNHDDLFPNLLSGCPKLEELIVERVVFSPDMFCCYVSSPTLKRLTLNSQYYFNWDKSTSGYISEIKAPSGSYMVEINAPALRYLFLEDWISEHIVVGELTSLIEADVCLDNTEWKEDDALHSRSMYEFVSRLCNVKYLKLSCVYLKDLYSAFSSWTMKFHNLTKLELTADWRFISMFLENADNLEILIVCEVSTALKCWTEPRKVPACLLSHLKTVKIDQFECTDDDEFELVRYLLRNAKVLKRMEICTQCAGQRERFIDLQGRSRPTRMTYYDDCVYFMADGVDVVDKFKALRRILSFEKGSEACVLAFD